MYPGAVHGGYMVVHGTTMYLPCTGTLGTPYRPPCSLTYPGEARRVRWCTSLGSCRPIETSDVQLASRGTRLASCHHTSWPAALLAGQLVFQGVIG